MNDEIKAALKLIIEAEREGRKDRDLVPLESVLVADLATFWDKQRIATAAGATLLEVELAFEDAVNSGVGEEDLMRHLDDYLARSAQRGSDSVAMDAGEAALVVGSAEYLRQRPRQIVNGINKTTAEILVANKLKGGGAVDIHDTFDEFSKPKQGTLNRAQVVAATEMGQAYEVGREDAVEKLAARNVVMQKRWMTVGDEQVCEICSANGGTEWLEMDAIFPSGHTAPIGHVQCRCDLETRRREVEDAI